jgi:hypothetical protein
VRKLLKMLTGRISLDSKIRALTLSWFFSMICEIGVCPLSIYVIFVISEIFYHWYSLGVS